MLYDYFYYYDFEYFFMLLVSLALVCLAIYIDCLIAKEFESIAKEKGYVHKKYFWITFLILPLGIMMVIALPDRRGTQMLQETLKQISFESGAKSGGETGARKVAPKFDDLPDL